MSYRQSFRGTLKYADAVHLEAGMDALVAVELDLLDLVVVPAERRVRVDFSGTAPPRFFETTTNALRALARTASDGSVRCAFEGEEDEVIDAGNAPPPSEHAPHQGWALWEAARRGDAARVDALVNAGARPPPRVDVLAGAARSGSADVVRRLLDAGLRSDHAGAVAASEDVLALLLRRGTGASAEALSSALYEGRGAAAAGRVENMERLAAHGAPLFPTEVGATSPVERAAAGTGRGERNPDGCMAALRWLLARVPASAVRIPRSGVSKEARELLRAAARGAVELTR